MSEFDGNNPVCKAPFTSIRYSANGFIMPCCWMTHVNFMRADVTTVEKYWNSNYVKNIRREMLQGKLPDKCGRCKKVGDATGYQRIKFFERVVKDADIFYREDQPFKVLQMDFNFSNRCNLKCRHCGGWNSSSWLKDEKKLTEMIPDLKRGTYEAFIPTPEMINAKDNFKDIKRLDFKGGEPLMQKEIYKLLENLVEWDFSKNIELYYITNGTKDHKEVKPLWKHFKKIHLSISFEGTGSLFSYIRGGDTIDWEQFKTNFHEFTKLENLNNLTFAHTIVNYAMYDLPNQIKFMIDTYKKYNIESNFYTYDNLQLRNVVTNPPYLDPIILPKEMKIELIEIYKKSNYKCLYPIINSLQSTLDHYDDKNWNFFIKYTDALDKIRNQSLIDVVPQFKKYISRNLHKI